MVNHVYDQPTQYEGMYLIMATVFFAFQVYCDFSGYTDIAIGAARTMGINLMENFRRPYCSGSIREFWSRWHISLTTWFRDYLYIPLGGNRVVKWRWYYNIMLVFVVSGLWHGANLTFIAWGALHGCYYIIEAVSAKKRRVIESRLALHKYPGLYRLGQVALTFAFVCFAWIFFRAHALSDAWYIASHLFSNLSGSTHELLSGLATSALTLGQTRKEFILAIFFILVLEGVQAVQERWPEKLELKQFSPVLRWGLYTVYGAVLIYFGVFNKTAFIYFQF
jgi:alginate O-acetyltransferase complex protein AlgI